MSMVRQRRRASELPCPLAEQDQHDDLVEADLHRGGHGTQTSYVLRNLTLLDRRPLSDPHAGPAGGLLDRKTSAFSGFADAVTEHATPDHTTLLGEVGRRKGREHLTRIAHILITPAGPACQASR